ncbi:hypothetical protein SBA1_400009 [Candidatus Sulfotelmatobacter kueseliae]|uniref:Uncharacterized protein n=1 Tax=Candidatus Sulfotelmatobacter kueseliae TaxID=2042962 RepID=A0A2U3KQH6_9BACT|nr:hypothetical protein SBA1_400009 [Candidatus Sulfotelmatobacter kueseliae]
MFAADWALAAIGRKLPAAVASKPRAEDSRNLRLVVSLAICQYPGKLARGWTHRHSRRIPAPAVLLPTKRLTSQHCGLPHRVVSKDFRWYVLKLKQDLISVSVVHRSFVFCSSLTAWICTRAYEKMNAVLRPRFGFHDDTHRWFAGLWRSPGSSGRCVPDRLFRGRQNDKNLRP